MLLLVVDTAGVEGGVLLARNENAALNPKETEVLGDQRLEPREFSKQLIPAIAELLQTNRLVLLDVDLFVVVSGPGSFTGLRVGLSAVKALAEVTAKPVLALSRLAIMASIAESATPEQVVHAVLDAGRGEFYHGIYRDAGQTRVAERLQTSETIAASFKDAPGVVVASEAVVLDAIGATGALTVRTISAVSVREALPLALVAWQARRLSDVSSLDANYLRRLDVEGPLPTVADAPASGP